MIFEDRRDAGKKLAEALIPRSDAVVLGIPRGGVIVAAEVADALRAPLDVVIPRKIGAPGNPELGLGAVAEGVRVLDASLIGKLGVTPEYLEREIASEEREIRRRSAVYRGGRPPVYLEGRAAVVIDDGVATGGTAVAALRWARAHGAGEVVFATPVAPAPARAHLESEADEVIILALPEGFVAVGQWYADFEQVEDEEVVSALQEASARM